MGFLGTKCLQLKFCRIMRIFDAPWINHDGGGVHSLDLHPSGKKLVTAGQDHSGAGLLMVWPLNFLADDGEDGALEAFSHLTRIPHNKGLNCARWSRRNSKRLVCAGVDAVVCVYECVGSFTTMGTLGAERAAGIGSAKSKMLENYRCIHQLYGHSMDVQHVDWSPDERFIASSSLDNTVIVWNAERWPERITTLREANGGHTRGVKGLAWDPMGRFLATQAEDNTLRLWQTDSWECVRTIDEPFQESAGSTLFLRMDWSPDGQYLVSPCAMNNGGPTANVLARKDWNHQRDFVGFRKAVSCVRANSRCFSREIDDESGECSIVSYFATGSRDRSLSVWIVPAVGRPLLVLEKFFNLSVLDLSWNDMTLAACSSDGIVRLLNFTESEIGVPLSSGEMISRSEKIYGFLPDIYKSSSSSSDGRSTTSASPQKLALDENFVYAAWHDAVHGPLAKSGRVSGGQRNIFHAKRKVSGAYLRRIIVRAKRQRRMDHSSPQRDAGDDACSSVEEEGGYAQQCNANDMLSSLLEDRPLLDRSAVNRFAEPAIRQQLHAKTMQWRHSSRVRYVTALNSYSIGRDRPAVHSKSRSDEDEIVTRIAAFGDAPTTSLWSVYTPDVVTALASNTLWTCYTLAAGRFHCHSTPTGRLLFAASFHTPFAQLILDGDNCVVVSCDGALTLCDLTLRRCFTKSLLALFDNDALAQRLVVRKMEGTDGVELSTDGLTQLVVACRDIDRLKASSWDWLQTAPIFDVLRRNFYPLPQFASLVLSKEDRGLLLGHVEEVSGQPALADSHAVDKMYREVCSLKARSSQRETTDDDKDEALVWLLDILQQAVNQGAKSEAHFIVSLSMLRIIRNGDISALRNLADRLKASIDDSLYRHFSALFVEYYDQLNTLK